LLGTLAYTFARIGAVVNLKVEDCFQTVKRSMIRFREKDGKETVLPVNHKLEELLHRYLEISGLKNRSNAPLFPIDAKTREPPGDANRYSQNAQTPAQRRFPQDYSAVHLPIRDLAPSSSGYA
jgi:integrase